MRASALQSVARYYWRAQTIYDVHAPLAYSFLGEVVEDDRHFYAFDLIEARRRQLLRDPTQLTLRDHGAGSRARAGFSKPVRAIARHSAVPPRFGRYLHKAVEFARAQRVLELGTNLGIGTSYLATAVGAGGHVVSIDADAGLLEYARRTTAAIPQAVPLTLLEGTFADRLDGALSALGGVDLAFVDGHHAELPTIAYFDEIAGRCGDKSIVIIDDVHWSTGMEAAWRKVREDPRVTLTIDLQRLGVVFFDPAVRQRQHLTIVPSKFKPWHMGFFSAR